MRASHLLLAVLFVPIFACDKKKEESHPAAPAASQPAPAKAAAAASSAAHGDPEGNHAGSDVGELVFKSHELPAPNKPVSEFKPATSGFKFQNYTNANSPTNLTPNELRRMFGDQVCASVEGGKCELTPVAAEWAEGMNKGMSGGHCEGFAALSLLMERGQIAPSLFGAKTTSELELAGNERLQREIAYWFVTQAVPPMALAEDRSLTPVHLAEKLAASFKGDVAGETYTLGFYQPGYKEGHATTPYAVVDKGDDLWIMHYDNNFPGEEKSIVVDKKTNVWTYRTAADPGAGEHDYKGDAETKTLTIAPTSVRTGPLQCVFCGNVEASTGETKGSSKGAAATELRELELIGDADLLITDEAGKRLGYVNGKLVNEIAGAGFATDKSGGAAAEDDEPFYFLPTGKKLVVTLDGTSLAKDDVDQLHLFGRGYSLGVENVKLSKGQKDEIDFAADGRSFTYVTHKAETPTLVIAIDTAGADYEFEVSVAGETAGQAVQVSIDLAKGLFDVKVKGDTSGKPTLTVKLSRYANKGPVQTFTHKGVAASEGQSVSFGYAAWKGEKSPLHTAVHDDKGAVLSEADQADED